MAIISVVTQKEEDYKKHIDLLNLLWCSSLIFGITVFLYLDLFIDNQNKITKENNTTFFKICFAILWLIILAIFNYFINNYFNPKLDELFYIELAIFILLTIFLFCTDKIHLDKRIKLSPFLLFLLGWIFFMISLLYIGNRYISISQYIIYLIILIIFFALIKITTHTIELGKVKND